MRIVIIKYNQLNIILYFITKNKKVKLKDVNIKLKFVSHQQSEHEC